MNAANSSPPVNLDALTSQLPSPPQQPLPSIQQSEQTGFLGSLGVTALRMTEGLSVLVERVNRFAHAIFEEIFNCTGNAKAVVTDVFSSFERIESSFGRNPFLDPVASLGRAWTATSDQAPVEGAKEAPAPEPAREEQPAPQSAVTGYKVTFLSKIDGIEHKATRLRDIALKIIVELGARLAALKSFVTISLTGLQEIGRVFQTQPLSSQELKPLFDQISQMFKNIAGKSAGDAAKEPEKAV